MIKNVIFDIGGVIVHFKKETYFDYFNLGPREKRSLTKTIFSPTWEKLSTGKIGTIDFKRYALNAKPKYAATIRKVLDKNNLKYMIPVNKTTMSYIQLIRSRGLKTYVLSDIEPNTIWYVENEIPNFKESFDGISYSCRTGMLKRKGKVFDYILKRFHLNPEETLFIDDKEKNLVQAQLRKIKTYKFIDDGKDFEKIDAIINEEK
ncbi:MAG: HAD family phosphatase [Clostridia bacterium]|nr:HAD family phosphatase [Clostridia bacterium]